MVTIGLSTRENRQPAAVGFNNPPHLGRKGRERDRESERERERGAILGFGEWVVAKKGSLDARRIGHRLLLLLLLGLEKMVSDAEIVKHLISVLKTADLATTTTTAIRQQLEQDLRVDLSDKKAFIRQQVDLYLQHQHSLKEEENEREDGEGEQQEEENEEESEENEDDAEEEQDEDDYVKQVARGVSDSKQQQQRLRHAKIRRSSKERYTNISNPANSSHYPGGVIWVLHEFSRSCYV